MSRSSAPSARRPLDAGVVKRVYAVYEGSAALRVGRVDVLPVATFLERLSAGRIIG